MNWLSYFKPTGLVHSSAAVVPGLAGGGDILLPPPNSSTYLAYYEASKGNGNPSNYGTIVTWEDQSGNGHTLEQATSGKRLSYRSFYPAAIYGAVDDYIYHSTAVIDKQAFSFFALADLERFMTRVTETHVLFHCSAGTLQVVVTGDYGTSARLVWVDAGGTHTSSIPVPSSLNLIGVVCSASAVTVWVNDVSESFSALTAGTINDGFSLMGRSTGNGWASGVVAAVLYNAASSAGQKTSLDTWAMARGARFPSQLSKVFVANGDSLSDNDNSEDILGYAAQADYAEAAFYSCGYPANTWATVGDAVVTVSDLYDPAKRCVMWLNAGINDINGLGNTDSQAIAKAQTWLAYFREKGFLVICNQLADAGVLDPTEQGYRAAYNVSLAALSTRQYANNVIAVPTELQDYTNLSYFDADTIHWTHAGHAAMTAAGQSALTSLLSQPVSSLKVNVDFNGNTLDSTVYTRDFVEINNPTYASGLNGKQCLVTAVTGTKYARYRATGTQCLGFYPLTVLLWIKTTSTDYNVSLLRHNSGGIFFVLDAFTGKPRVFFTSINGGSFDATSSVNVKDGNWHAVAFSIDASGVKIYTSPDSDAANLSLTGSASWTGTPGPHNNTGNYLNVGCEGVNASDVSFQGLRMWSEARTLVQLQAEIP